MNRTRAPGAGNAREVAVMSVLAEEGWLCASRRHIGGAGDVLAVKAWEWNGDAPPVEGYVDVMLVEVKSTTYGPWDSFGPGDRQALVETATRFGASAWLFWWAPRKPLHRIPSSAFPPARQVQHQPQVEG